MTKIMIVWMIFGIRLQRSFLLLATYSFHKYLRYRQTQTSGDKVENTQPRCGSS